jgi:hypothetical protein
MRRILLTAVLLLALSSVSTGARFGRIITVTAGTPIRLATVRTIAARIMIQMLSGGTGRGYAMDGVPEGTTPVALTWPTVQMAPATATAPGGTYTDTDSVGSSIDLSRIWVDGSQTGDTMVVTYYTK